MEYELMVIGNLFADLIYTDVPAMPTPGQEVYAGGFTMTGGGAYITAVAAHRLGLQVGIVAAVGSDSISSLLIDMLHSEGIDTSLLYRMSLPMRNVTVSFNYDHDRSMLSYSDAMDFDVFRDYVAGILTTHKTKWTHLSATPEYMGMSDIARAAGSCVSMDVGWDADWLRDSLLKEIIASSDLFMPNRTEAQYITATTDIEAACSALTSLARVVVVTDGEQGATVQERGGTVTRIPAERGTLVRDFTGAGDNFSAGMLYGLMNGYTVPDSVRIGVFCGSASVSGIGGTAMSPGRAELHEWLSRQNLSPCR